MRIQNLKKLRDTAEKHALLTSELQKDTATETKKKPKLRNYPFRTKPHIPIEPYDAARDIVRSITVLNRNYPELKRNRISLITVTTQI